MVPHRVARICAVLDRIENRRLAKFAISRCVRKSETSSSLFCCAVTFQLRRILRQRRLDVPLRNSTPISERYSCCFVNDMFKLARRVVSACLSKVHPRDLLLRAVAYVELQQLHSRLQVRRANKNLLIHSAWASDSSVNIIEKVCGANNQNLVLPTFVQLNQEFIDLGRVVGPGPGPASAGNERVQFVEKEKSWRIFACFLEQFANFLLASVHIDRSEERRVG